MKSKVYFTKNITPEKVLDLYKLLSADLTGNIATVSYTHLRQRRTGILSIRGMVIFPREGIAGL